MPSTRHIATYLGLLFLAAEVAPLSAQTEKKEEEIKLNEDAIKMIQFDFVPNENRYQPLNAPMDKKWMQFKEDLSMPRSMIDSTRVKKSQDISVPNPIPSGLSSEKIPFTTSCRPSRKMEDILEHKS